MHNYNKKTLGSNVDTDDFWNNNYEIDESDITDYNSNETSSNVFDDSENSENYDEHMKTKINKIIEVSDSKTTMLEMELITKLNNKITKDKRMSLIIAVLLEMIFGKNDTKLNKIYNFLNKNNLLDLDVISNNYNGIRKSLSSLINYINVNSTNVNSTNINLVEIDTTNIKTTSNNNLQYNSNYIVNYIENYISNNITNADFQLKDEQKQNLITYNELDKNILSSNNVFVNNKYRTNFNQIKLLGQGAYGSVYKVFHKYEKKYYAIKKVFITKEIIEDNYDIFREIQIYSDLMNEHVVRFYGSWIDIDVDSIIKYNNQITNDDEFDKIDYICPILFIQMELCDFTLKDYLLTWSEHDNEKNKIDIVIQILNGLEYLGSKNIIHRDIKPDNIFLIKNKSNENELNTYKVKIGDFGLCKKYIDINQNKNKYKINVSDEQNYSLILNFNYKSMDEYVGTGIYRAPEIETKKYDFSIDIYSIGIIMIELFINFTTQSEKIILVSKLKTSLDLTLLNKITNNEIKKIIISMINVNPNKRPGLKDILLNLTNIKNDI